MSRFRNIQELFLICKPLWFILFRRLSWKKHVWRVEGAWRRVALKLSSVVGSRQASICDQDGLCNTRDRTLSVYFGGSSSKQAIFRDLNKNRTNFFATQTEETNLQRCLKTETTTKASWIWFAGSNDFWWSNGQRHRDLRGVCNPRPSADATTTNVDGLECLLTKNHKIRRSLQNEHLSALQEFDLCFGSGSMLEVNVGCTARGLLWSPLGQWISRRAEVSTERSLRLVEPFPTEEQKKMCFEAVDFLRSEMKLNEWGLGKLCRRYMWSTTVFLTLNGRHSFDWKSNITFDFLNGLMTH